MKLERGTLLVSLMMAMGAAGAAESSTNGNEMSGDDEWACKVAMCMSNPGGPSQVAECDAPMERLRRHLRRGRPFPVCRFLGGGGDTASSGGGTTRPANAARDPLQAL